MIDWLVCWDRDFSLAVALSLLLFEHSWLLCTVYFQIYSNESIHWFFFLFAPLMSFLIFNNGLLFRVKLDLHSSCNQPTNWIVGVCFVYLLCWFGCDLSVKLICMLYLTCVVSDIINNNLSIIYKINYLWWSSAVSSFAFFHLFNRMYRSYSWKWILH